MFYVQGCEEIWKFSKELFRTPKCNPVQTTTANACTLSKKRRFEEIKLLFTLDRRLSLIPFRFAFVSFVLSCATCLLLNSCHKKIIRKRNLCTQFEVHTKKPDQKCISYDNWVAFAAHELLIARVDKICWYFFDRFNEGWSNDKLNAIAMRLTLIRGLNHWPISKPPSVIIIQMIACSRTTTGFFKSKWIDLVVRIVHRVNEYS